jgi:hypothetical protein
MPHQRFSLLSSRLGITRVAASSIAAKRQQLLPAKRQTIQVQ